MRKIIYILLLFFGLSLLLSVFLNIKNTKQLIHFGQTVDGRVIEVKPNTAGKLVPKIVFPTAIGEYITIESPIPTYEQGEVVQIFYNPEHPQEARINSFASLYPHTLSSLLLGILFTFLGVHRFIYFWYYQKKLRSARTKNLLLIGHISKEALLGWGKKLFPFSYLLVEIHYTKNNIILSFGTPLLWRPSHFLQPGQPIELYVDQNNPNRYYMDIPHLLDMI